MQRGTPLHTPVTPAFPEPDDPCTPVLPAPQLERTASGVGSTIWNYHNGTAGKTGGAEDPCAAPTPSGRGMPSLQRALTGLPPSAPGVYGMTGSTGLYQIPQVRNGDCSTPGSAAALQKRRLIRAGPPPLSRTTTRSRSKGMVVARGVA